MLLRRRRPRQLGAVRWLHCREGLRLRHLAQHGHDVAARGMRWRRGVRRRVRVRVRVRGQRMLQMRVRQLSVRRLGRRSLPQDGHDVAAGACACNWRCTWRCRGWGRLA